jgi:hypothetical protein
MTRVAVSLPTENTETALSCVVLFCSMATSLLSGLHAAPI